jgi:DNA-binding response OmpR family regulator
LSDPDDALTRSNFDDVLACLINLELPGMTGLDLHERLRPRLDNIPVFMVDDQCDSANEIAVLATGRLHYLCKPVEPALLDALVPQSD